MNRRRDIVIVPLLIVLFLFANMLQAHAAGTLKIGQECTDDDQCVTGECEKSSVDKPGTSDKKTYCVCDAKEHCSAQYGGNPDDWSCSNGATATLDLNYCLREKNLSSNKNDNVQAPINLISPSALDALFNPSAAAAATVNEIKQITQAPQPRINIPGLTFTDPSTIKSVTEDGEEILYIPFLGEYIAAIYRYMVIAVGVISIIVIIVAGARWTLSAGSTEAIGSAKKQIVGAVTGLVLAVGSYTLLYTINPNLVEFRSLRITQIQADPIIEENESGNTDTLSSLSSYLPPDCKVTRPPWTHATFDCPLWESRGYTPQGVIPSTCVVKYTCPGIKGNIRTLPELKDPVCKAGQLALERGYTLLMAASYRSFEGQARNWCVGGARKYPDTARRNRFNAVPGFSNHGLGIAVDVYLYTKDWEKPLTRASSVTQCQRPLEYVNAIAQIFYDADPRFERLDSEIWHFTLRLNGAKASKRILGYPPTSGCK